MVSYDEKDVCQELQRPCCALKKTLMTNAFHLSLFFVQLYANTNVQIILDFSFDILLAVLFLLKPTSFCDASFS